MKVVGVTGTNGETNPAEMVSKILEEAGYKVVLMNSKCFRFRKSLPNPQSRFVGFGSPQVNDLDFMSLGQREGQIEETRFWVLWQQNIAIKLLAQMKILTPQMKILTMKTSGSYNSSSRSR